ncbi:hypothetical protein [Conexibacter sp. CPCC 206217]|uniref:hypothetical protein n=1 Tax=Conexibacter sp. CPCC 206217 TaxID=3064574 RepID=UPI00271F74D8|nr:hypothetical protein [Conexibacter sp. CPCC 206217]MDO8211286.1 hypothetical protein [Conexibacter sp. CPCC 206217]
MDDGHAIAYKALKRGTLVRDSEGAEIGKVARVQDNVRENIFDGIVVDTREGKRFVDAPEVGRIAERAVTLTITAAEVAMLPVPRPRMLQRLEQAKLVRRARRTARDLRDR